MEIIISLNPSIIIVLSSMTGFGDHIGLAGTHHIIGGIIPCGGIPIVAGIMGSIIIIASAITIIIPIAHIGMLTNLVLFTILCGRYLPQGGIMHPLVQNDRSVHEWELPLVPLLLRHVIVVESIMLVIGSVRNVWLLPLVVQGL